MPHEYVKTGTLEWDAEGVQVAPRLALATYTVERIYRDGRQEAIDEVAVILLDDDERPIMAYHFDEKADVVVAADALRKLADEAWPE